jgi:hypothetical protein
MILTIPLILFIVALVLTVVSAYREYRSSGSIALTTWALLLVCIGLVLTGLGFLADPVLTTR